MRSHAPRHAKPWLEPLETRALLSTCNVTRLTDQGIGKGLRGDLRYCITKANAEPGEDLILFQPTAYGTINLPTSLPNIADDLIIAGPGADLVTLRRSTGDLFRLLTINSGVTAQVFSISMTNGNGGILNLGTLTLSNVAIVSNFNEWGDGGGITNLGGLLVFESTVSGNTATVACGGGGGGIYNAPGGVVTVSSSTLSGNRTIGGCESFVDESPQGGGIYNAGTLAVELSTLADNENYCGSDQYPCKARGGGIYNDGTMTLFSSLLAGNKLLVSHPASDDTYGGGIYNHALLVVDSSTLSGNLAGSAGAHSGNGGALYSDANSTLTLINSTVANNQAPAFLNSFGGGVAINGATATIRNSTFVGNFCGGKGLAQGGGLGIKGNAKLTLHNTILAANFALTAGPDIYGNIVTSGFNLVGDPSGGSGFAATDLLNVDPLLGPLTNNGGPTQTFALLPGSPAIDAGDNTDAPEFDQRGPGYPRVVNGTIDIGAFEVQATTESAASLFLIDPLSAQQLAFGGPNRKKVVYFGGQA